MVFVWVPHNLDVLPFFRMTDTERRQRLQECFGPISGGRYVFQRSIGGVPAETVMSACCTDDTFRCEIRIPYGCDRGMEADVVLDKSGIASITLNGIADGAVARDASKDVAALLRECFSPLDLDARAWGREQLSVSDRTDRDEAVSEIIGSMIKASSDRLINIQRMVADRSENGFDSIARQISTSETDPIMDELRARRGLLSVNGRLDTIIEDEWGALCTYLSACSNFMTMSGALGPETSAIDNCKRYATLLHDRAIRRHSMDAEIFGQDAALASAEMQGISQHQSESMDRLSKAVAVLTGVTTALELYGILADGPDIMLLAGLRPWALRSPYQPP